MMYRQYEDPHVIEQYLKHAKEQLEKAKKEFGECDDRLVDYYQEVEWLEERLNFAWQDDEAEEFGYDY